MEMMTAEIESECWQFLSLPDQSRGEPGSEFPCPFLRLKCLNISFHLLQWVSACMHNVLTVLFHMELTSSNTSYRPLISWTACEGSEWRGISIKSPITAKFKKRRLLKTEQRKMARNCENGICPLTGLIALKLHDKWWSDEGILPLVLMFLCQVCRVMPVRRRDDIQQIYQTQCE